MRVGLVFLSRVYTIVLSVLCSFAGVSASTDVVEVGSFKDLRHQLSENYGGRLDVVLVEDICIRDNLIVDSGSLNLNLNGHSMVFESPDVQILVGKKVKKEIPYEVRHPAQWETKTRQVRRYDDVLKCWRFVSEPYYEWVKEYVEVKYKTEIEYHGASVSIENGNIRGADGRSGKGGAGDAYWYFEACGEDGGTPLPLFKVISGGLRFSNCRIRTGDGGNGGDATYAALWHIPFIGGGDGGRGGDGGNGGSLCLSEKGQVLVSDSNFKAGHGGKAGKGSKANPNYWLWSGSDGKDGKCGRDGGYLVDSDGNVVSKSDKLCMNNDACMLR